MQEAYHVFDDRHLTGKRIAEMKNEAEELLHSYEAEVIDDEIGATSVTPVNRSHTFKQAVRKA